MARQASSSRKRKPVELMEGDGVQYKLKTSGGLMQRTGRIVMKNGRWCLIDLFGEELDDNGQTQTVWIQLRPEA